ncbi:DUF6894 family protein [Inquilinus sp. OTU3971]|uniref:DUF6894 family protein n=1 Tax=Inquilinus sp. OTU3971 TaxID=3043855 RepID=UPI00313ACBB6
MRYFFHIEDRRFFCRDEKGGDFPSLAAAFGHASRVAGELRDEGDHAGGSIVINDMHRSVILRVWI